MSDTATNYLHVEGTEIVPTELTITGEVKKSRVFLGMAKPDWKDYIDTTLPAERQQEVAKAMRKYDQKMLKAYLRGAENFRYGFNGRDEFNRLNVRIMPVLQEYN